VIEGIEKMVIGIGRIDWWNQPSIQQCFGSAEPKTSLDGGRELLALLDACGLQYLKDVEISMRNSEGQQFAAASENTLVDEK
jgi:hypothetical protein